jgi:hypothetical protein
MISWCDIKSLRGMEAEELSEEIVPEVTLRPEYMPYLFTPHVPLRVSFAQLGIDYDAELEQIRIEQEFMNALERMQEENDNI